MNKLKKVLALVLVLCMTLSMVPFGVSAATASTDDFMRVFHLDVGRKYFTVAEVQGIIDTLAAEGYSHLELAIGNDGLRLILDDMSVESYTHDAVTAGIQAGNQAYYDAGDKNEWTQSEMDTIIAYADSKNIEIIPLVNTPGHMDAIVYAMEYVGIQNPAYENSVRTVDVTNTEAVAFTQALVAKYAAYFAGKGCTYFNMGADEYANDAYTTGAMGFGHLQSAGLYDEYAAYVNAVATIVKDAGMTPIAFNDGFYFNNVTNVVFDSDIVIAYWTSGWGTYTVASASDLATKGHKILNTNDAWYYVLGRSQAINATYCYESAMTGAADTPVTDVPGSNDPDVIGAMNCVWCDTPSVSYAANAQNVTNVVTTLADSNPTYYVAASTEEDTLPPATNSDASKTENVTLTVGGTETVTIEGVDYSGDVDDFELDTNVATVDVDYTQIPGATETTLGSQITPSNNSGWSDTGVIKSGDYYLVMSSNGTLSATTNVTEATVFTVTRSEYNRYTIRSGDYYVSYDGGVEASASSYGWYYNNNNGFYRQGGQGGTRYLTYSNGSWSTAQSTNNRTYLYDVTTTTTDPVNATTITFNGVAVGETSVVVGDTRYNITVLAEDLGEVDPLQVDWWITNAPVTSTDSNVSPDGSYTSSGKTVYYANVTAEEAYGVNGIALSSVVPATGKWDYSENLVFWKGTRLTSGNEQTGESGSDSTTSGNDFAFIRYYNGNWQFSADRETWTTINSTDQIVAYYLQKEKITEEIDTLFKDWGLEPDGKDGSTDQVALTVAVVYPDGTLSPSESEAYPNSTIIFNYWDNRNIGIVAPVNNSTYTISKITVTDGMRTSDSEESRIWTTSDTITWEKVTDSDGVTWYDETVVWDDTMESEPAVSGTGELYEWPSRNSAKLILIYLDTVSYDTNLIVNWVDDSAGGSLIHDMEVAVSSDEETITFYNGLKQTSALPEEGVGGAFTLDDDAYVTNSSGVNQTFNKNITTIPDVAAQYRSGLYEYVGAELSADGKTLTLHYSINSAKLSPLYVVDFGLPMTFNATDLVDNASELASVVLEDEGKTNYGSAVLNSTGDIATTTITYTPNAVLRNIDVLKITVTYTGGESATFRMGFVPATTVYYEEGFATVTEGDWTGGKASTTQQQTQIAAKDGVNVTDEAYSQYGYDDAYAGYASSNSGAESDASGEKISFTFAGTGVDVYANCTETSGIASVLLYQGDSVKKMYQVDTRTTASAYTGNADSEGNANGLPIVSIQDLEYGTYTVVILHNKRDSQDVGGSIFLDGFRVYNTLNNLAHSAYVADEMNPTFIELRDQVLAGVDVTNSQYKEGSAVLEQVMSAAGSTAGAIYVSNVSYDDNYTLTDILDNGPKNELFLRAGEAVTFNLKEGYTAQIGLKTIDASATYTVNNVTYTIDTPVDMFYHEVSGEVTITNTSGGILSVTKLKVFGSEAATADAFEEVTESQMTFALRSVGVAVEDDSTTEPETPVEPEQPEVPETPVEPVEADAVLTVNLVDYKGDVVDSTELTETGLTGQTASFGAERILNAVHSNMPANFAVADEAAVETVEVAYGENGEVNVLVGKVATLKVTYRKNGFGGFFGWFFGSGNNTSTTVTLTAVQTSDSGSYRFSAQEIKDAAPEGYTVWNARAVSVRYGSTQSTSVTCR